jgi:hypothetical protein
MPQYAVGQPADPREPESSNDPLHSTVGSMAAATRIGQCQLSPPWRESIAPMVALGRADAGPVMVLQRGRANPRDCAAGQADCA